MGVELPPILAARYLELSPLGGGGFGRVVLARDRNLDRLVAIKLLRSTLPDLEHRLRFEREARLTAQLQHPHIVRVYDSGYGDDGAPYIVYEYVPGRTLESVSPADLRPGREDVVAWGRELCGALSCAHRAGVLHRDVKPANVLVREDGHSVLADFGIARVESGRTVVTRDGIVLGTPGYLAPEVFMGEAPSPASDQFALAATLFRVAWGEPVFGTDEVAGILDRLRARTRPSLPAASREAVPVLGPALLRALDPDPARRFPDLDAFDAALAGRVEGRSAPTVLLDRPPAPEPAPPPSRAVPLGLSTLAAAGLALVLVRPHPAPPVEPVPAAAPGASEQAVAIELRTRLGYPDRYDPWILLDGLIQGDDEARARDAFDAAWKAPDTPWTRFLRMRYRESTTHPLDPPAIARILEDLGPSDYRAPIPDFPTGQHRLAGLALRLLEDGPQTGSRDPATQAILRADLQWTEAALGKPVDLEHRMLRTIFWDMLSRRLQTRPNLNLPAAELAAHLARDMFLEFDGLAPYLRLHLLVLAQGISASLGERPHCQALLERYRARVLEAVPEVGTVSKYWRERACECEGKLDGPVAVALSIPKFELEPGWLPLPADWPGSRPGRSEPWHLVPDPARPDPIRLAGPVGVDPDPAFQDAAVQALVEGRELQGRLGPLPDQGPPGVRKKALDPLVFWPELALALAEQQAAAGSAVAAAATLGRCLELHTVIADLGLRGRAFRSGPLARVTLRRIQLLLQAGDPEQAAALQRSQCLSFFSLPGPHTHGEAQAALAIWNAVPPDTRRSAELETYRDAFDRLAQAVAAFEARISPAPVR